MISHNYEAYSPDKHGEIIECPRTFKGAFLAYWTFGILLLALAVFIAIYDHTLGISVAAGIVILICTTLAGLAGIYLGIYKILQIRKHKFLLAELPMDGRVTVGVVLFVLEESDTFRGDSALNRTQFLKYNVHYMFVDHNDKLKRCYGKTDTIQVDPSGFIINWRGHVGTTANATQGTVTASANRGHDFVERLRSLGLHDAQGELLRIAYNKKGSCILGFTEDEEAKYLENIVRITGTE